MYLLTSKRTFIGGVKMAKAIKYSAVAAEIKKEYLKEHLQVIRKLIETWITELSAPAPLYPCQGKTGWQSVYVPSTEKDPDSNHMIKRHIRSRALWSHHTKWEADLENMWPLINNLRQEARSKQKELSTSTQRQYCVEFTDVALWKGFDVANGMQLEDWYKIPDDEQGISYGAYKLELSAATQEERSLIKHEHREYIDHLAKLNDMHQLIESWREVIKLQKQMQAIGSKILKSGDILYSCTFCKHLWR